MNNRIKLVGTIVGVVLFICLVVGLTYAYILWQSENINVVVNSKCFNVFYTKGNDISGDIMPSFDYTGGLFSTVMVDMDDDCEYRANGKLYLITDDETSVQLFREGLLNYQVLKGNTEIASGSITEYGKTEIDLGELSRNSVASTSYTIYVWIDYNLVQNSDAFLTYSGTIEAEAIQIT